jgi:hypothetical protein
MVRPATVRPTIIAYSWGFKAQFKTHYVPCGTLKLKREFSELQQGDMTVNEYLNRFTQMSRYARYDVNTDEKKHDAFLNGLNDEIQFQLLNTDYKDFQRMVNKAIFIENKIKEMEKNGKRELPFQGQSSESPSPLTTGLPLPTDRWTAAPHNFFK